MADLIVKSRVKGVLEDNHVSADFYDALDQAVSEMLEDAARRAAANDRKTVQPRDLSTSAHELRAQLEQANRSIRSLLDTLYADARFDLVRYEGNIIVHNNEGDTTHRKTYVLTADQPTENMTSYVEVRESDDFDRVFKEIRESCEGGTVSEDYTEFKSAQAGEAILGFEIKFDEPVHEEEHTVTIECDLEDYFIDDHYEEWVQMALPTHRSELEFVFPEDWRTSAESTAVINPKELEEGQLDTSPFSKPAPNQLKWEIDEPGFGKFYQISFEIDRY